MAKIPDITSLNLEELQDLIEAANARQGELKKVRIEELKAQRAALDAELAKLGGPDGAGIKKPVKGGGGDVVGNGRTRAKPAIKFRDDKGNTWTGRGATPRWLKALVAEGKNLDEYKV